MVRGPLHRGKHSLYRVCIVCDKADFRELLDRVSPYEYRHQAAWAKRCAYLKEHPHATMRELRSLNLPGVSMYIYPEKEESPRT